MIQNYLRIAFRNITKHKFISVINISGLTMGLACCLLILTYILNEQSYDKFNKNANEIYRVTRDFYTPAGVENLHISGIAPPFGPLLQNAFPEIKKVTRLLSNGTTTLRYREKFFNEKNAYYADGNFFEFFNVPSIEGDMQKGLSEPYSVMMSEITAHKYFGNEDPINKTILLDNNKHEFKVTGVFQSFPANSHIHPELLMSFNTLNDTTIFGEKRLQSDYGFNAFYTYLLLPKGNDPSRIEAQFPDFLDKYVHFQGMPGNTKTSQTTKLELQKLTDIHLRSHLDDEIEPGGDIKRVYIFSAIALFILLIACINYMNLSTARSALRAKEIGIRKVVGAQRKEIIFQFLSESVLVTCFSLVLAIVLALMLLPVVDSFSGQHLSINGLTHWQTVVPIVCLPFIIGLISGVYPAIFMSSFIPVKVLKGLLKAGPKDISFRKVLVVLQFSISIILIVATTVIFQQLRYLQDTNLGFNKDRILTLDYPTPLIKQYESFKSDLLRNSNVKDMAVSLAVPSSRLTGAQGASVLEGGSMFPIKVELKFITADYGFIPVYGIHMAAGRNFSRAFTTDTNNFILNETAVQALGWKNPQNAIGKDMTYGGMKGKVVGVVNDFHFESLHQKIIPLLMLMPSPRNDFYKKLSIKISGNNINEAVGTVENTWHKYLPETPFDFSFLDDKFAQLYKSEQAQGNLFTLFAFVAIFIACLGLFGLSAFTISQRIKEIGVRKVLGASVPQIVVELSKDFLKLVLIAGVIAVPISWYTMNGWLNDFAFRIAISWWIFILAGVAALIIAFATISFQSVKAALANPVKSLKSE